MTFVRDGHYWIALNGDRMAVMSGGQGLADMLLGFLPNIFGGLANQGPTQQEQAATNLFNQEANQSNQLFQYNLPIYKNTVSQLINRANQAPFYAPAALGMAKNDLSNLSLNY